MNSKAVQRFKNKHQLLNLLDDGELLNDNNHWVPPDPPAIDDVDTFAKIKATMEHHVCQTINEDLSKYTNSQKQLILDAYASHLTHVLDQTWTTWLLQYSYSEQCDDDELVDVTKTL